jgi:drug/metabolite transporter (DMT)-like permease
VQPVLTAELLFLVILLATWFRFRVGWREWISCAGAAGGLAGFLIFAQPGGGSEVPSAFDWVVAGSLCGGTVLLAILSALRGPRWWRAAAFGLAAAVGFAFTASLIKTVSDYIATDWIHMFFHWQTYGVVVCGALSLFVTKSAFHAGPIAASQTALVLVDPLASIALGIGLYGDSLRTAGAYGPLEAISLLIMFVGAASIALSPLVSGMKGDDDRYAEMLSLRSRSKRLIDAVQQDLPPE